MHQQQIVKRIEYLQAELVALARLVELAAIEPQTAPVVAQTPEAVVVAPQVETAPEAAPEPAPRPSETKAEVQQELAPQDELPPEPDEGDEWSIDPARAAELLGISRQTVDRRLKDGVKRGTPGAPRNVSGGQTRARWKWRNEAAVRSWWDASK